MKAKRVCTIMSGQLKMTDVFVAITNGARTTFFSRAAETHKWRWWPKPKRRNV